MSQKAENAVNYHKQFYPCSAAVLCAFCADAGMNEKDARAAAMPFAGGKMGKCGAVLAAEYVLGKKFPPEEAKEKVAEFENRFTEMNRTLMCKELKGSLTGTPIRSCRGCVTDAAELLDELLK